jgi:hypothetical protein
VSAVGSNESKPSTFPSSETELLPTNGNEHENMQKPDMLMLPHHNSILTEHECELDKNAGRNCVRFSAKRPEVGALIEEHHHAFCLKKNALKLIYLN